MVQKIHTTTNGKFHSPLKRNEKFYGKKKIKMDASKDALALGDANLLAGHRKHTLNNNDYYSKSTLL